MLDPVDAYEQIAPLYPGLAAERKQYLDAIDRLVVAEIPRGSHSMLDIGAGDGARSRHIAAARGIAELIMLEPSCAMQRGNPGTFWTSRAEDLQAAEQEFDVVTCLWNSLGHIRPRAQLLRQLHRLLAPEGRLLIDVSHRYNALHYGRVATMVRWLADLAMWTESRGDVTVRWGDCVTWGHVFTSPEIESLAHAAGFRVEKRLAVNYATGAIENTGWRGHLFYVFRT